MYNYIMVTVIMGFGGIIGGTINFVNDQMKGWSAWFKQVLLSTAAALLVPLFLALAKSGLLESLLQSKNIWASSDIFVFLGFCLVAGIASNRFISSISERILREVKRTKEEVKEIQEQTEPILEQLIEPDEESTGQRVQITDEERKILNALNNSLYKLRSISGIVAETKLPREKVEKLLKELKDKGLVIEVNKTRKKGIRWMISNLGLRELKFGEQMG